MSAKWNCDQTTNSCTSPDGKTTISSHGSASGNSLRDLTGGMGGQVQTKIGSTDITVGGSRQGQMFGSYNQSTVWGGAKHDFGNGFSGGVDGFKNNRGGKGGSISLGFQF